MRTEKRKLGIGWTLLAIGVAAVVVAVLAQVIGMGWRPNTLLALISVGGFGLAAIGFGLLKEAENA